MHPRVGAARALNRQTTLRQLFEHVSQGTLDGGLPGLNLPTAEIGAVIGQREFDVAHKSQLDYRTRVQLEHLASRSQVMLSSPSLRESTGDGSPACHISI